MELINIWKRGYAHRVSVGRCAEEKFTIKDVYNILDTCLLVLLWRIKQIRY
jgi:hypothetical protein